VQEAFFPFSSMLLNGAYASKFETVATLSFQEGFTSLFYLSRRDSIGVHAKKSTIS
jgi:hypothetical protein